MTRRDGWPKSPVSRGTVALPRAEGAASYPDVCARDARCDFIEQEDKVSLERRRAELRKLRPLWATPMPDRSPVVARMVAGRPRVLVRLGRGDPSVNRDVALAYGAALIRAALTLPEGGGK